MAEYIDREEIFPNGVFYVNKNQPEKSLDELINRICKAPTADVVEVVRCRDCWKREKQCFDKTLNDDDFCSKGERRSDNENT